MTILSQFNDGMRYILVCINVFANKAYAVIIKAKATRDVTEAFERITGMKKPLTIQSDEGTKLLNSTFQTMLQRHGIHFYTSENEDLKASVVKRFNNLLFVRKVKVIVRPRCLLVSLSPATERCVYDTCGKASRRLIIAIKYACCLYFSLLVRIYLSIYLMTDECHC